MLACHQHYHPPYIHPQLLAPYLNTVWTIACIYELGDMMIRSGLIPIFSICFELVSDSS